MARGDAHWLIVLDAYMKMSIDIPDLVRRFRDIGGISSADEALIHVHPAIASAAHAAVVDASGQVDGIRLAVWCDKSLRRTEWRLQKANLPE